MTRTAGRGKKMNVTWYGTASIKLDDGDTTLLFDPYVRPNKKLRRVCVDDFTGADAILVTHGHVDHIADIPTIAKADRSVPVYCTKNLEQYSEGLHGYEDAELVRKICEVRREEKHPDDLAEYNARILESIYALAGA